jgi:hypothetical protein
VTTASPSAALVTIQPAFAEPERLALAGVTGWVPQADPRGVLAGPARVHQRCRAHSPALFSIRRADVERFAGELETTGPARATVTVGSAP